MIWLRHIAEFLTGAAMFAAIGALIFSAALVIARVPLCGDPSVTSGPCTTSPMSTLTAAEWGAWCGLAVFALGVLAAAIGGNPIFSDDD